MKEPELVTATQAELDEILQNTRAHLSAQQFQLLEGVLSTFVYVMLKLQNAKTSLKRFQRMLFGHSTEHKRNVLGSATVAGSGVEAGLIEAGLIAPAVAAHTDAPKKVLSQ